MFTVIKWILRIVPVLIIIIGVAGFVVVNKYPDFAFAKGVGWIELYRSQIGGLMKIEDPGFWISLTRLAEKRSVKISRDGRAYLDIYALRFHPERVDFRVISTPPAEVPATPIGMVADKTGAMALINANYFDTKLDVLGLCVADGNQIAPIATAAEYEGLFVVTDKSTNLVDRKTFMDKNFLKKGILKHAVQSEPWLVLGGKPIIEFADSSRVTRRSAIAIDGQGRILLLATDTFFSGATLADLAKVLGAPEKDGGFGVKTALSLDGGASTQLFIKTPDENYLVRGFRNVPAYIGVFEKPS